MGTAQDGEARKPVRAARPPRPPVRPVSAAPALLQLQASAGNAAVAALLAAPRADTATETDPIALPGAGAGRLAVQRQGAACPPPVVAPAGTTPGADPRFTAVKADLAGKARTTKAHPPATAEAKQAQDAAVAPADDKDAQAKTAQVDKMAAAKPAGFDKAAFIAAVNAAVAKQSPQNLDEAAKFAGSGKADQIKSDVLGKVTQGKDQSTKDVADKTHEPPDQSRAVDKPVTPLPPAPPPPALGAADTRGAVPAKAPPQQTDLRADQCETDAKMADAGVTEDQLAKSNEPEFTGALAAKKEGEQHTATAPGAVRESESRQLAAAQGSADAAGHTAVTGMLHAREVTGQKGAGAKSATKSKDEADRARITGEIKGIFDATKADVEKILGAIDTEVTARFDKGEAEAKAAFKADHEARMARYKDARYSGLEGALLWTRDLFADLPPEANQVFVAAKKVYETKMQAVIAGIADYVGGELTKAKDCIALGRDQVKQKVADQPVALRKIAEGAAKDFQGQFEELDKSVDEKQQALVEDLAEKYTAARTAIDEEIKALQEANKGLWSKAQDAVGGAIQTIMQLKDMLLGVLARAANAVDLIVKDPIAFLGNLVNAVKTGVMNFGHNIVDHLKAGLKAWLLGNLASAGIEIPETFDLRGILKLVLSLLGLTWANVRSRILKFIPEPVLKALEGTVAVVGILVTEGLPGLWKWVLEKVGDLKELVLGQIKSFVIEKIVMAGITWIISLLNPAAAFIKACKAIYDIVMFFVEKAAQIKEFVDTVLDSIVSIAGGGVGAVAGMIEKALAKALPLVLGMLASLLGLGGVSEKIKGILTKIQAPVNKVIDSVVGTVVKAGKSLFKKMFGKKDKRSPAERKAALDAAMTDGQAALKDKHLDEAGIRAKLATIKSTRKVKKLDLVVDQKTEASETVHVVGANSPTVHGPKVTRTQVNVAQRADADDVTAVGASATVTVGQDEAAATLKGKQVLLPGVHEKTEGVYVPTSEDRQFLRGRWLGLAAQQTDAAVRAQYNENARRAGTGAVPANGKVSEQEVTWLHEHVGAGTQGRYRGNTPVQDNAKGTSIPDLQVGSWQVETKRYLIFRDNGAGETELIAELKRQFAQRLANLPYNTRMQAIIVDLRGQTTDGAKMQQLRARIHQEVVIACYAEAKAADKWYVTPGQQPPGIDTVVVIAKAVT
jgi:hypothetical protein